MVGSCNHGGHTSHVSLVVIVIAFCRSGIFCAFSSLPLLDAHLLIGATSVARALAGLSSSAPLTFLVASSSPLTMVKPAPDIACADACSFSLLTVRVLCPSAALLLMPFFFAPLRHQTLDSRLLVSAILYLASVAASFSLTLFSHNFSCV